MNKLLEETITKAQETIEQSKDVWNKTYEDQAKVLTESKELLDQFYKQVKSYDRIQFYLAEVSTTPPAIFKIQARYQGQPIALITITKDTTLITTEEYEETNKKIYGCNIKLEQVDLKTKETMQFLTYFNKDIEPKGKIDEQLHTQAMLLSEFAKTSSVGKLLLRLPTSEVQ